MAVTDGTTKRTPLEEAATEVILSIFRANGLLLATGDQLAAPEGLTSARWQVIGAIALADHPLTVPQIARRMGLTRQSVHATVRHLVVGGFVELVANSDHRRSQLVCLTARGQSKFEAMDRRQGRWVAQLAKGVGRSSLATTAGVLMELCRRLELDVVERPEE